MSFWSSCSSIPFAKCSSDRSFKISLARTWREASGFLGLYIYENIRSYGKYDNPVPPATANIKLPKMTNATMKAEKKDIVTPIYTFCYI